MELASLGAKVLQNRSVELAKKLNVNDYCKKALLAKAEGTGYWRGERWNGGFY